ncbi:MAG TPA: lysylphosphatidylglycerol synthase transmembrane domain-containing protein [Streptosporangiaceae bacterium]|nr:lysylphosphatidylglycerol synthase transmembrane domain-containing protein [Streptosporangiaceae bacterium]
MSSPRPGPHPGDHAGTADQVDVARAPGLVVEDHRARRIRRPIDLLRCLVAILGVFVVAGIGLLARETASGIEIDAVNASLRLPHSVLALLGIAADFALLLWPAALAIRQVSRHQARRLVEAALTGAAAIALIALANVALRGAAGPLYDAIAMPPSGPGISGPLDGYLAGLAAYATIIGLTGRSRWRTTLWLTVGVYGLANLATASVTVPSFLITLLLGRAIGLGVRYAAGEWSQRPTAEDIASALNSASHPVVAMRRIRQNGIESRHYAATARGGGHLDVRVYDRDQEAAGALYRLYRRLRLQGPVRRGVPLSQERAVERRALLSYAADEAGVRTPRLVALVSVGSDANALAYEYRPGTTLAELAGVPADSESAGTDPVGTPQSHPDGARRALTADSQRTDDQRTGTASSRPTDQRTATAGSRPTDGQRARAGDSGPTDDQLLRVWEAVLRLHAHRVTHRTLTADRILFADDGDVVLLDPGGGDVAASDLQLRLDLTQLLAELALLVGPDRAARLALKAVGADEMVAVVPLLQPIVLHRTTRSALRRRKDVLPALRTQLLAAAPGEDAAPVRLERVRPRTIVTLIASLIAGYLLLGQLGRVNLFSTLRSADWHWTLLALALSGVTYLGAAFSLSGYVPARLRFRPLVLAQLAGSFVTLVTPAAVGGAALNIRYLQRRRVPAAVAAASVGLSQVVAFVLHILLLVVFAAITGSQDHSLQPPNWVYFVIAALIVIVLAVVAIPAGRRLIRARLAPVLGQVLPRLLAVVQQPRKLAEGIGGTLLLTGAYILCLAACIRALGGSASLASIAVVYLTGSALGSAVPTPGGLGAVEAALSAGLTAAGLPGATAVSAVLLFRTLTFWLPVPVGWGAFNYLERHQFL